MKGKLREAEYLKANPDVAAAVKEGKFRSGREHYEIYGEREKRLLRRLFGETPREAKAFHLCDRKGLGLEIGPSHNPIAPKKRVLMYISLISLVWQNCETNIRGMASI